MSNLNDIKHRHGRDRWKDAGFIALAALLTALAVGSVTSKAVGSTSMKQWKVTVVESNLEIGQ